MDSKTNGEFNITRSENDRISKQINDKYNELIRQEYQKLPDFTIQSIYIKTLSHEDILKESVTPEGINSKYNPSDPPNESKVTLFSPNMGVSEKNKICSTCHRTECMGHPGHINFRVKGSKFGDELFVYNPMHLKSIFSVLRIVCHDCGSLLPNKDLDYTGPDKLKVLEKNITSYIEKQNISPQCRKCFHINSVYDPKYFAEKQIFVTKDSDGNINNPLPSEAVYAIFKNITNEDILTMGFAMDKLTGEPISHPKDYIMQSIQVIPPKYRPIIISDTRPPEHNPITKLYEHLIDVITSDKVTQQDIRINNDQKKALLQKWVGVIFENKSKETINNQDRPYPSISSYIQGKEGMLREQMLGKRSNQTGRTVVAAGPELNFGEIGIPRKMAKVLTVQVICNQENKDYLMTLIINNKANYHIPSTGSKRGIKQELTPIYVQTLVLEIGDVVERQLQEGDYVVFNRQPTLHKYSMMSARVKLHDENVIRIPLSYTKPLNADFDGDELNIHNPQTPEAMEEARTKMYVGNCLINNQTNAPTFGAFLDGITGMYLLTQDTNITEETFTRCNSVLVKPKNLIEFRKRLDKLSMPYTSGKSVFSLTLPDNMNYSDDNIIIINGILTKGVIKKGQISTSHNALQQYLFREYGPIVSANFITDTYKVADMYLQNRGFTISLADCPSSNSEPIQLIKKMNDVIFKVNNKQITNQELIKVINDVKSNCKHEKIQFINEQLEKIDKLEVKEIIKLLEVVRDNFMTLKEYKELQIYETRQKVQALGEKPKDEIGLKDYEKSVNGIVNRVNNYAGRYVDNYLLPTNSFKNIIDAGAKGSKDNIVSIIGIVGQQNFKGERLVGTMLGGRCSPVDLTDDPDIEARGYCTHSLLEGLTPKEEFSHLMASREGLIDTAINVQETGYTQRKMMKSFEDIRVNSKGGVTTSKGKIIQFIYGEDGFNSINLHKVQVSPDRMISSIVNIPRIFKKLNNI